MTDTKTCATGHPPQNLVELIAAGGRDTASRVLPVPADFTFVWNHIRFHGRLDRPGATDCAVGCATGSGANSAEDLCLCLRADMAPVPYTAENPGGRGTMLKFVEGLDRRSGERQRINARRRLEYSASTRLPGPVRGLDIMTVAVGVLLQSAPLFERALATTSPAAAHGVKPFAAERNNTQLH